MTLAQLALAAHEDALALDYARKTLALARDNPVALQILALGLLSANDIARCLPEAPALTSARAGPGCGHREAVALAPGT